MAVKARSEREAAYFLGKTSRNTSIECFVMLMLAQSEYLNLADPIMADREQDAKQQARHLKG